MSSSAGTETDRDAGARSGQHLDGVPPVPPGSEPPPAPPRRRPRPVFFLAGLVLAAALAVGLFTGIGTGGSGRPTVGSQVPTFSVPRLLGPGSVGVPANGGANGRPVILLFFASWCTPCQTEIPALATTYRQEQTVRSPLSRAAVVGIDAFDPKASAVRFVRSSGVTFPVGTDRNYDLTEGRFYFTALPEAVFVNGDGTIASITYGAITSAQLQSWQHRLLAGG